MYRHTSAALFLLLPAGVWAQADGGTRTPSVPVDAHVFLTSPKKEYLLGENIVLQFCIANKGKQPFKIDLGGDYRGATRHLRYKVTARDERGNAAVDPDPSHFCMGGLGHSPEVVPGKKHREDIPLLAYCRFEHPGTYTIRITHDLGWRPTDDRPHPVAEIQLKLIRPTLQQSRRLIDKLYTEDRAAGEFQLLRDPIYLPILTQRAEKGCNKALAGIAGIATPEATRALIRLASHSNPKFALGVVQTLNMRLPDPQFDDKLGRRNVFLNDWLESRRWLSQRSWKPELAAETRALAHKFLTRKETEALQCGAFILQCLGTKEDVRHLIGALDRAVPATKEAPLEKGIYPRPRGACQELLRATHMLNERFGPVPFKPRSPGEAVVFLNALGSRETFRPRDWQETLGDLLRHDIPYVRETALVNMPLPIPKPLLSPVGALLLDRDVDVQLAACNLVGRSKTPGFNETLVRLLTLTKDAQVLRTAYNAARLIGDYELIELLVNRLGDPAMTARCLDLLAGQVIANRGGGRLAGDSAFDEARARAVKARWDRFLKDHGKDLARGKTFKLGDPALTPDLFPDFEFQPWREIRPEVRFR